MNPYYALTLCACYCDQFTKALSQFVRFLYRSKMSLNLTYKTDLYFVLQLVTVLFSSAFCILQSDPLLCERKTLVVCSFWLYSHLI